MKLGGIGESSNVSDRRGMGLGGGAVAVSGTGIVLALVVGLITGRNPLTLLGVTESEEPRATAPDANDPGAVFTRKVLKTTEDTWNDVLPRTMGRAYKEPTLVLFRDQVRTACGTADAAVGPFYCPGDQSAFVDLDFLDALQKKLGAKGDFAAGYVIAHEIGHHVQRLTGAMGRGAGREEGAGGGSVRVELQADCYAGVWGHHVKERGILDPGDVEEALGAAAAIGDDTLQKRARGRVTPETFSHGTSEQRVRWFERGMESGDPRACDTFGAPVL